MSCHNVLRALVLITSQCLVQFSPSEPPDNDTPARSIYILKLESKHVNFVLSWKGHSTAFFTIDLYAKAASPPPVVI